MVGDIDGAFDGPGRAGCGLDSYVGGAAYHECGDVQGAGFAGGEQKGGQVDVAFVEVAAELDADVFRLWGGVGDFEAYPCVGAFGAVAYGLGSDLDGAFGSGGGDGEEKEGEG